MFKNALSDARKTAGADFFFTLRAAVNAKGSGISNFLFKILFLERNKQWNKNLHFSDCAVPAFLNCNFSVASRIAAGAF